MHPQQQNREMMTHREIIKERSRKSRKKRGLKNKMRLMKEFMEIERLDKVDKKSVAVSIMNSIEEIKESGAMNDKMYLDIMNQLMSLHNEDLKKEQERTPQSRQPNAEFIDIISQMDIRDWNISRSRDVSRDLRIYPENISGTNLNNDFYGGATEYIRNYAGILSNYSNDDGIPEVSQPEVSQPEVSQPEVSQPEVSQPEVSQPEEIQPEASQPEEIQPEASQPEVSQPEAIQSEVILDEVNLEGVNLEGVSRDGVNLEGVVEVSREERFQMELLSESQWSEETLLNDIFSPTTLRWRTPSRGRTTPT